MQIFKITLLNANLSIFEKDLIFQGFSVSIIGILIVCIVLIFIALLISKLELITSVFDQKPKSDITQTNFDQNSVKIEKPENNKNQNDEELIAIISAAISAYTGVDEENFVVKNINKISKW